MNKEDLYVDLNKYPNSVHSSKEWYGWDTFIYLKKMKTIQIITEDDEVYLLDKEKVLDFLKSNGLVKKMKKKVVLQRDAKGRFVKRG